MDPITLIVTATALGAAAGLKPTAEKAVKDAYAGLKRLISDRYQAAQVGVDLIERDPGSESFQNTTRELLQTTDAGEDEELLRQAKEVAQIVEQYAPETGAEIHIKVEDVKAASNFRIKDVVASGARASVDLDVKKVEAGGDFEIKGIRATGVKETGSKEAAEAKESAATRVDIDQNEVSAGRDAITNVYITPEAGEGKGKEDLVERSPEERQRSLLLARTLADRFSMSELEDLLFVLGINPDNLKGDTLTAKARELVEYYERRDNLSELIEAGRRLRKDIDWDQFD